MSDKLCGERAVVRYTWAGNGESYCCIEHAKEIKALADAIGYYVQMIPILDSDGVEYICQNKEGNK